MACWMGSSHSSHHPAKLMGLAPRENEDKIFLILSSDHTIEVPGDFVDGVLSS